MEHCCWHYELSQKLAVYQQMLLKNVCGFYIKTVLQENCFNTFTVFITCDTMLVQYVPGVSLSVFPGAKDPD